MDDQANREVGLPSNYMPYAPAAPVIGLLRRLREGKLPDPLNPTTMLQVGIAEGNAPRIFNAMRFLRLINDQGGRTAEFDRLRRVSTEEYPRALAELVQAAYAPVLTIVDPAVDNDIAIADAFRGFEPIGQRSKMVAFFSALLREAAMLPGGPITTRQRTMKPRPERPAKAPTGTTTARPTARPTGPASGQPVVTDDAPPSGGPDYRLLSALVQQLPREGRWSQERRDRWIGAITATIDLLVEVEEVTK
jgi:hypothetical protein